MSGGWDEPFVVSAYDDGRCGIGEHPDHPVCARRAKWHVEPVGWTGPGEPPENPTYLACTVHLAATLAALVAS